MAPLWGTPTSTLDWCEHNYTVTWYIAEFWNTVSNLSMIIPALYGVHTARKNGFEKRYEVVNWLFLLVGIGSWAFHMTLRWEMQLLDEIPMVYGTAYMIHCMYLVLYQPKYRNQTVEYALMAYCALFTAVYLVLQNPIIHQTMYGALVFVMIYQGISLLRAQYCKEAFLLYLTGFLMYLVGFTLWNIDNNFCGQVTAFRNSLPEFLQPLTQLHAWWHILAGYATYLNILYSEHHRLTFLKRPVSISSSWVGLTVVKHKRATG